MDKSKEIKLISVIKGMISQRIDENAHEIIEDYEQAENSSDKRISFPISIAVKFAVAGGKAPVKCKLSWGVKRSSEDDAIFPIDGDLFEAKK